LGEAARHQYRQGATYTAALAELKKQGKCPDATVHRQVKYLTDVFDKTFFAEWCYPLPARVTAWPRASIGMRACHAA
jgi:hypothetical protein